MKFIQLEDNKITVDKRVIDDFDFNSKVLGKRAKNIILASEKISKILQDNVAELYFKLRVEI
jgi:hypothetical protein